MKKLFLPILFILLFITTPVSISAQYPANCWDIMQDNTCLENVTDCNIKCGETNDQERVKACLAACDKTYTACSDERTANYKACVEAGRQNKQPLPKSLTCEELSKLVSSEDCLYNVMVDFKVWCAKPGENLTEFTADQIKLVPPNRAPDYVVDPSLTSEELKSCQKKVSQEQVKKNKSNQDGNPFNIFGINPFQMWLNLQELAEAGAFYGTGGLYDSTLSIISHGVGVTPSWERDEEAIEANAEAKKIYEKMRKEMVAELEFVEYAQARYFSLTQQEKNKLAEILNRWEGRIEPGGNPVIFNKDSTTIQLQPFNGQPGVLKPSPNWPMLNSGAVDVIVEPQTGQQFELQTPNVEIFVIGTKFSVIYDPNKNQTLIAVYEGKVEVRTNDGKTAKITPDGDKPGVVVVSQKLSPFKVATVGVVLAAVLGGTLMVLKRKFAPKGFSKKKK